MLAQTDLRLAGQRTIPDRRISLVDPDAPPVRQGNPGRPTEFGYKAVVADTAEGFVIVDVPTGGAPVDGGLLEDAIVKGTIEVASGAETAEVGAGSLLRFEPAERHSLAARTGGRILLILAPWPGEGHYQPAR